MTAGQLSSTVALLHASSDDETTLQFPLPDSTFGFHAQQAVEKLYKALLAHRDGTYPYSHDLASLRRRLEAGGIELPKSAFRLEDLSEYAGNARYGDPLPIDEPTRDLMRREIVELRRFVIAVTAAAEEQT